MDGQCQRAAVSALARNGVDREEITHTESKDATSGNRRCCLGRIATVGSAIVVLAVLVAPLPAVVWLAAAAPAVMWAAVICLVTRRAREPLAVTLAAILAGAVLAAWPSSHISQALQDHIGGGPGDAAPWAVPGVLVPSIEELIKAVTLVLLSSVVRGAPLDVMHGMRRGALIGIGFSMLENVQYLTLALLQGGIPGLWRGAYVRGVIGGLHHAVYAATAGAGIGAACQASRPRVRYSAVGLGLGAAVTQHILWNTTAATAITEALCDSAPSGGSCRPIPDPVDLFAFAPLIVALALGPGVIALLAVAAAARRGPRALSGS